MGYNETKFEPKRTAKGTELPLLSLKGKPYLQVAHRIVWFREEHPTARIETKLIAHDMDKAVAIFMAGIYDENDKLISTGYKKETAENFADYLEKAETGAIGRALALAGYGTQFEPDFDEQDRLADSPIAVPTRTSNVPAVAGSCLPVDSKNKYIELVTTTSAVAIAKKRATKAGLVDYMKKTYNKSSKDELTADEANAFANYLQNLIKENSNGKSAEI